MNKVLLFLLLGIVGAAVLYGCNRTTPSEPSTTVPYQTPGGAGVGVQTATALASATMTLDAAESIVSAQGYAGICSLAPQACANGVAAAVAAMWCDACPLHMFAAARPGYDEYYDQRAFFFTDHYLGTDTSAPSANVAFVSRTADTVILRYTLYNANDGLCCPSGGAADVRFQWDGRQLTSPDPIPSDAQRDDFAPCPMMDCGDTARWVVVAAGIDSSSSCADNYPALESALRTTGVGDLHVIVFSYSGQYEDCTDNASYGVQTLPASQGRVLPYYAPTDTCQGVAAAATSLEQLIDHLWRPGTTFDLIGHSLGGLVTSYFISRKPASYVHQRVHSVILLDSPVHGFGLRNPLSSCSADSQSWTDLALDSYVTRVINNPARTTSKVPFVTIRSSEIGGTLPGAERDLQAGCYSSGGISLWDILPFIGEALELETAHNCVWNDPVSLGAIAQTVAQ